ncbi:general substrate transporter [Geopyxis carbonaria]|nr:general substrate transporter [Geopyxis carbonaria]
MANTVVILLCVFVSLGALIFGMDGGYFSGVLAMESFIRDYGTRDASTHKFVITASRQSFYNSFPYVGQFLACLGGGYLGDRFGRKPGLLLMCVLCAAGVLLQLFAAGVDAVFVLGRFIAYAAIGLATVFVPLYQAECAPRGIRGTMVTLYQLNIVLGSFLISIVNNFSQSVPGTASYRIPIGILLILPILIAPGLPFLPESPRWLMKKRRTADARHALAVLHRGDTAFDVDAELHFLAATIAEQESLAAATSWADCFRGANRRRTALACLIQVWQQFSGISFIFNYGTLFFTQIGIGDPFLITIMTNLVNLVGTLLSFALVDRVGRRPLLLAGSAVMFAGHIAVGICGLHAGASVAAQRGIVAFVLIYIFGFAFSWGPLAWVITSEIATNSLRERTQALGGASNILFSFIVSFSVPYLVNDDADSAALGPKVGFIFAAFVVAGAVYTFWWVPETKGRALEELDEMFLAGTPARAFVGFRCVGAATGAGKGAAGGGGSAGGESEKAPSGEVGV